ncbi:NUDIX hydrolase [Patescibacteria group bacterium]|nr:NUDIX hydrolase [Patescibacteria group bacterium]
MEKGESIFQATKKELKEETNLDLISLEENPCLEGQLDVLNYPPILISVYRGKVSTEIPFPNDSDVEKVNWIEAKTFLDSLKERNYPSEEIVKIEKFLISEGLLNSQ